MKRLALLSLAALVTACADAKPPAKPVDLEACTNGCGGRMFVLDDLAFLSADDDNRIFGWNLDGIDSDGKDPEGCRKPDYMSPDGVPGIDNQMAVVVKEVISFAGEAFPQLIHNAIRDGGLGFVFEIVGSDSELQNGKRVAVAVRRTSGKPLLGTDNNLLPGQTLALHAEPFLGAAEEASLVDSRLEAGPFVLRLPAVVFGIEYQITLVDAHLALTFGAGATDVTGYVGGSFRIDDIHTIADTIDVEELGDLVRGLIPPMADIRSPETGSCDRISVGVKVHGIPAFVFAADATAEAGFSEK